MLINQTALTGTFPMIMNNLKPTWKLPVIALLGIILLFASACNNPSPFTKENFEGLHLRGDTVHLSYEKAVPSKETRRWCSGTAYEKDICVSQHVDTTFVVQGKPLDAKMAADGCNARTKYSGINWGKHFDWVPPVLAILVGLFLLALALALLGVLRDAWNRFWQTSTSPATSHQPPPTQQASAPAPTAVPTGTIAGNDQYLFSVPKGTRVEVQMGNGSGFVNNGIRPAGS